MTLSSLQRSCIRLTKRLNALRKKKWIESSVVPGDSFRTQKGALGRTGILRKLKGTLPRTRENKVLRALLLTVLLLLKMVSRSKLRQVLLLLVV